MPTRAWGSATDLDPPEARIAFAANKCLYYINMYLEVLPETGPSSSAFSDEGEEDC